MRDTLRESLQSFREPDLSAWAFELDEGMRNATDPRLKNPQLVAEVIAWACSNAFWRGVISTPAPLFRNFDQLCVKMEADIARNQAASLSPAQRRVMQNQAACAEAKAILFGGGSHERK